MHGILLVLALATPNSDNYQCNTGICWRVSPTTCATEHIDQPCQSTLSVQWHSATTQSLCVAIAEQTIHCWRPAKTGVWQHNIPWQNAILSLQTDTETIILQTQLQVLSRQPIKPRRLNGPWSIF
jgi:hypothetical protein